MNAFHNKKISLPVILTLSILTLFGLFTLPAPAEAITCDSVTLTGTATTGTPPARARLTYDTNYLVVANGNGTPTIVRTFENEGVFAIQQYVSGLSENTTYYYRLEVTNHYGTEFGSIKNFTTPSCGGSQPQPTVSISANPITVAYGGLSILSWDSENATSCSASGGWSGSKNLNGTQSTGSFFSTTTFSITCRNDADTRASAAVTVGVQSQPPPENTSPKGYMDVASCSEINGWAFGTNYSTVRVELTDGSNSVTVSANGNRQDVGDDYPDAGDWHGFSIPTPSVFKDSYSHTLRAYLIDSGSRIQLGTSPKTFGPCVTANKVDGGWSSWSTKSNQCGISGTQTRTCSNPSPSGGGRACTDPLNPNYDGMGYTRSYTNPQCSVKVDGGWSDWSQRSTQCGYSGVQTRTCTNPSPQNGGAYCSGPSTQTYTNAACSINNPSVDLSASDASIDFGEMTTLIWTVQNATSCSTSGNWSGNINPSNGSQIVGPLYSNKTYNIVCSNSVGSDNDSITISVGNNNTGDGPDVTTRSATSVDRDEATLRGEVDGNGLATRVWFEWSDDRDEVEDGDGEETDDISTGSGTDDFDENIDGLRDDTTYYFRAVAENAEDTDYGSILSFRTDEDANNNGDRPSVSIFSNPSNVNYGGASTVTWNSSDADTCRANGGTNGWFGSRSRSGIFYTGTLYNNTTFSITCENDEGSDSDSTTVTVGSVITPQSQPTVIVYADQTSLSYNGATTVRWSTVGATSCQASGGSVGWAGPKSIGPGSFYTGSLSFNRTFTITCSNNSGSATDSVTISVRPPTTGGPLPPPATSLVLVTSSVDRTQPIIPTLDNTKPCPGDEINYAITYQNIGTGAVRNLILRLDLPFEVSYMFSNPNNPTIAGNTLTFNLGTLGANSQDTVTVRVRVRDDAPIGANLNFPALLSYLDPAGSAQTVTANVVAQVWCEALEPLEVEARATSLLGANVFGAGFWPDTLFEWLLLLILILLLILLIRYLIAGAAAPILPPRRTTTTTVEHH